MTRGEHTPASAARLAAGALDSQAEYIAAGSDLAHRTANLARTLIAWGRACDVVRRAHPASVAAEALEKLALFQSGVGAQRNWICYCRTARIGFVPHSAGAAGCTNETMAALLALRKQTAQALDRLGVWLDAGYQNGEPARVQARYVRAGDSWGGLSPDATSARWAAAWRAYAEASNCGLPAWPRWHDVPRSPHELAAMLARVEGDSAAVQALADDVRRWAREYDEQTDRRSCDGCGSYEINATETVCLRCSLRASREL